MIGILEELEATRPRPMQMAGQMQSFLQPQQSVPQLGPESNFSNLLSTSAGEKGRLSEELLSTVRRGRQSIHDITPVDRFLLGVRPRNVPFLTKAVDVISSPFTSGALQTAKAELGGIGPSLARAKSGGLKIPVAEVEAIHKIFDMGAGNSPDVVDHFLGGVEDDLISARKSDASNVMQMAQSGRLPMDMASMLLQDINRPIENLAEIKDPSTLSQLGSMGGQLLSGAGTLASLYVGAKFGRNFARGKAGTGLVNAFKKLGDSASGSLGGAPPRSPISPRGLGGSFRNPSGAGTISGIGNAVHNAPTGATVNPVTSGKHSLASGFSGGRLINALVDTGFAKSNLNPQAVVRMDTINKGENALKIKENSKMQIPFSSMFNEIIPEGTLQDTAGEKARLQRSTSAMPNTARAILNSEASKGLTEQFYDHFNKLTGLHAQGSPMARNSNVGVVRAPIEYITDNHLRGVSLDKEAREEMVKLANHVRDRNPLEIRSGQESKVIDSFLDIADSFANGANENYDLRLLEHLITGMNMGSRNDPTSLSSSKALMSVRGRIREIMSGALERHNTDLSNAYESAKGEANKHKLLQAINSPNVSKTTMRRLFHTPAMRKKLEDLFEFAGLSKEEGLQFAEAIAFEMKNQDNMLTLMNANQSINKDGLSDLGLVGKQASALKKAWHYGRSSFLENFSRDQALREMFTEALLSGEGSEVPPEDDLPEYDLGEEEEEVDFGDL